MNTFSHRSFPLRTLYVTALLASALSYVGIVGLIGLSVVVGSGNVGAGVSGVLVGLLYTALPAALLGMFITAPLGALIAKGLMRFSLPAHALGATTGMAATLILSAVLFALFDEFREPPDKGSIAMLSGVLTICTISGALALRVAARDSEPCEPA